MIKALQMKIQILTLILLAISYNIFAYTGKAVISDPDGYTNVRSGKGINSDIITKISEGLEFLYNKDCNSDWWQILLNDGSEGYVHESRIKPIHSKYENHEYKIKIDNENILLSITEDEFNCDGHKITRKDDMMVMVDGEGALGTGYSLPITEIVNIKITWNNVDLHVPKELYSDCYNPFIEEDKVFYKLTDNGEKLLFFLLGSDGAGVYDVLWIFDKNSKHSRAFLGCCDCSFLNFECVNY